MNLTNNEFEVLIYIERNNNKVIETEQIAKETNIEPIKVNLNIAMLSSNGIIKYEDNGKISVTSKGYQVLEPYRVKKAIILAAGKGTRLRPITNDLPKPLVKVNNKRIIENLLDALKAAEIEDVTIVRGYLPEKFNILLEKYPYLKFIDNKEYNVTNNMSSAFLIKDELNNAYVMEADLELFNPHLIRKYEYQSNYLGKYVKETDDWRFETKDKNITNVMKGGKNCYQMYGIGYVAASDGEKLKDDIANVYLNMEGGKDRFWDDVHLSIYNNKYNFKVRECFEGEITEIDTVKELQQLDKSYSNIIINP